MRVPRSFLLLLVSAAVTLLTSCSGINPGASSLQSGTSGSDPAKTTPLITWSQPAAIDNQTPLSSAQLDATANVTGTFAYSPAAGTVLTTGSHTLSVSFTPDDTTKYNSASTSVTIQVNAATQPVASANCSGAPRTGAGDFVYVSSGNWGKGDYQVAGFAAAADGSLAPVTGSPFATPGLGPLTMDGNGPVLFGTDRYSLYSYAVDGQGCLGLENTTAIGKGDPTNPTVAPLRLMLDAQNSNLYSADYMSGNQDSVFASYKYDASTGAVTPTGVSSENMLNNFGVLAVDSSAQRAITSDCGYWSGNGVSEYTLKQDGGLTAATPADAPLPAVQQGYYWCPAGAAADQSGHVVIAMQPCPPDGPCYSTQPWQLAVYSIDGTGTMTPLNGWQTMPQMDMFQTPQVGPNWFEFSPDHRYFAVSGYTGLEVFAWDAPSATLTHVASLQGGTCQSTPYSQSCTGDGFGNIAWDSNDHLYTLKGNQMLVYAVSNAGLAPAPGSPYTVQDAQWVIVVRDQ